MTAALTGKHRDTERFESLIEQLRQRLVIHTQPAQFSVPTVTSIGEGGTDYLYRVGCVAQPLAHQAEKPPSMVKLAPVMYPASGPAR